MKLQRLDNRARSVLFGRRVHIWYEASFRLPLSALEGGTGFEPRRADYVAWFLVDAWAYHPSRFHTAERARYHELARVHTAEYLESLLVPRTLARIFAVDERDLQVDEVLTTVRKACGATIQAARYSVRHQTVSMNLFGGFHHAAPDSGGGFCAVNDIAVAIADLRQDGFLEQVVVIDLDAHPPDGLAACFERDPKVWVGSLSGSDWGRLRNVDETVLPEGCEDVAYMRALEGLLQRMPPSSLAFVIAGGDVLRGDRLGHLGLTLAGARQRDLRVFRALRGIPSVWLPGGGYSQNAWKALAGTALALLCRSEQPINRRYDPMRARFRWISGALNREALGAAADTEISMRDLEEELGVRRPEDRRLLGYYSAEGIEYALFHYGILPHLRRLGYSHFEVAITATDLGDNLRLYGQAAGRRHLIMELLLEKRRVAERDVLYVHWLTLRDPRAQFSPLRPQLPGQEHPGLGMAREIGQVLGRVARRLGLAGVVWRPAWYHTAYTGRHEFRFIDPERQGRFEAFVRDLRSYPLVEVTRAAAEGRVRMNGQPYTWEADEMAAWLDEPPANYDEALVDAERARVRFTIAPAPTENVESASSVRP